jgi:ABC-2 type transport system ATP-binding protein
VEARHLRKSYGSQLAVKDVSFSIRGGEVLGLLGPNGAGKSTSMMMVAGLLEPTSGDVLVNGQKFDGQNADQRRLFGLVPQEYAIYEELSSLGNLKFFGNLYGLRGKLLKERCDEVLEEIGLTDAAHRVAGEYSGGMKRRLNFGIALMQKPALLIMDEPTLGVDPQSRNRLMDCIRRQTAKGVGVIYASHYMEEVQSICERVAIIDQGMVLVNDSIHHLLSGLSADLYLYVDRTHGVEKELGDQVRIDTGSDGQPAIVVSGIAQVSSSTTTELPQKARSKVAGKSHDLGDRLRTTLDTLKRLGITVLRVETQQSNLERLFLQLTGKRLRD